MERLFVDVDDTLIRWEAGGGFLAKHALNRNVTHFVRVWRQTHPAGRVTVWSLGGEDYARKHAHDYLPGLYDDCAAKEPLMPQLGWLFLDDDPLPSFRPATIHPDCLGEVL